jgi:hypothetical protein
MDGIVSQGRWGRVGWGAMASEDGWVRIGEWHGEFGGIAHAGTVTLGRVSSTNIEAWPGVHTWGPSRHEFPWCLLCGPSQLYCLTTWCLHKDCCDRVCGPRATGLRRNLYLSGVVTEVEILSQEVQTAP